MFAGWLPEDLHPDEVDLDGTNVQLDLVGAPLETLMAAAAEQDPPTADDCTCCCAPGRPCWVWIGATARATVSSTRRD